ncbi:MAG: sporulation integral membrane protein YlbJ [Clostridium sp.]
MFFSIMLWLFIITLIITLFKLLNIKKNYLICFLITFLIILFIINMEGCIIAAINGANLVVRAILPTIFPFTVICNLLISFDGINLYSKILGPLFCRPLGLSKNCSFPIVASFLCGYPLGAKYSSDLYNMGYIKKNEYKRLLNIASNAGPIFLIGSIGAAMLSSPLYGYILLIANYSSLIIVGFLTKKTSSITHELPMTLPPYKEKKFGIALKEAIENGINTTLNVAAFVILFSVIINIIKDSTYISTVFYNLERFLNFPKDSIYSLFLGSIEFTNGCKLIASSTLPINLKLSIISFICSFSGLSIIAQVSSFISKDNISIGKYAYWKLIQGLVSFIITFVSSKLLLSSVPTSSIIRHHSIFNNIYVFILPLLFFLLITLILKISCFIIKKLHVS